MTVIGGKGKGVGHGTLIRIETAVVAISIEVFSSGKYLPFAFVITDVLGNHEPLGQGGRL